MCVCVCVCVFVCFNSRGEWRRNGEVPVFMLFTKFMKIVYLFICLYIFLRYSKAHTKNPLGSP